MPNPPGQVGKKKPIERFKKQKKARHVPGRAAARAGRMLAEDDAGKRLLMAPRVRGLRVGAALPCQFAPRVRAGVLRPGIIK